MKIKPSKILKSSQLIFYLTAVVQSTHIRFDYDPQGRRTGKPALKLYMFMRISIVMNLWLQLKGDAGQERIHYFHTNVAGLPEQLTDQAGNTLWQAEYKIWGKTSDEWHDNRIRTEQNLRYQGQYLDRETELHYDTFRYYDPDIGRFTQHDPIGLEGGINLYQYAPNPLGWVDPLGLACSPQQLAKNRKAGTVHEANTTAALKNKYGNNVVQEQILMRLIGADGKPVNYRVRLDNVIFDPKQALFV